ncbi:hypothetical protein FACS1894152_8020 [Bacilli bacterium]|nr:hypothetical protein FACS1894152_8020 [Bacilli bacterium]
MKAKTHIIIFLCHILLFSNLSIAKISYNKDKDIVLFDEDSPMVNGYSSETPNGVKIISVNLANNKTVKQLMQTLYHESYDSKAHETNEWLAKDYANHIGDVWDTIVRNDEPLDIGTWLNSNREITQRGNEITKQLEGEASRGERTINYSINTSQFFNPENMQALKLTAAAMGFVINPAIMQIAVVAVKGYIVTYAFFEGGKLIM